MAKGNGYPVTGTAVSFYNAFNKLSEAEVEECERQRDYMRQTHALLSLLRTKPRGAEIANQLLLLEPIIGGVTPEMLWRAVDWCEENAEYWRERHEEYAAQAEAARRAPQHEPLVYYMLQGGLVKIGTSRNLNARLQTFRPEKLLAVEPGDASVERTRHRQFAADRSHGEWFRRSAALEEHIRRARREHADLFKYWEDWTPGYPSYGMPIDVENLTREAERQSAGEQAPRRA